MVTRGPTTCDAAYASIAGRLPAQVNALTARLGQKLAVRARLVEYEMRLKIDYLVAYQASGARLTRGHTVQVAVDMSTEEMLPTSPKILHDKLEALQ